MHETILNRFIKGTFFTGIGRLLIVGIGLLGFMLTARWLTTEELGLFTLLQVSVGFIISFSDLGIGTSVTRHLASSDDPASRETLIYTAFYSRILTLAAASIMALIARQALFNLLGGSTYLELLVYLPVLVSVEGIIRLLLEFAEGLFQFHIVGTADVLSSLLSFIGILILVINLNMGLEGRIFAKMISDLVTLFFLIVATRFRLRLIFAWTWLKKILIFGFPLYVNQVLTFAFLRADTVIIGSFLGASEIALYEIARKIPESIEMLYDAFRKVYFPFISNLFSAGKRQQCTRLVNTSTRMIAFLGGIGILGIFLFGEEIILLLFSDKYLASAPIFSILMISLVLLVIDYTLGYTLVAIGESNKPPLINIVHTVVNFAGYFFLIPIFRVAGAAVSNVAGTAVVNPLNMFLLRRKGIQASYRAFLVPFLITGVCLGAVLLFRPQILLLRAAILLLYLGLSFMLSVITRNDLITAAGEIRSLVKNHKIQQTAKKKKRHP